MSKFGEFLTTCDDLEEAVGQALGMASMCWDPRPTGVFESRIAAEVEHQLVDWIRNRYILGGGTDRPVVFPPEPQTRTETTETVEGSRGS